MKLGGEEADQEGSGELIQTVPTIGVDLEEIKIKNVSVKCWDLSG